jgi:hypothetical protein
MTSLIGKWTFTRLRVRVNKYLPGFPPEGGADERFSRRPGRAYQRSDAALRLLADKAKLNGYALDPDQSSSVFGLSIDIHLGREDE